MINLTCLNQFANDDRSLGRHHHILFLLDEIWMTSWQTFSYWVIYGAHTFVSFAKPVFFSRWWFTNRSRKRRTHDNFFTFHFTVPVSACVDILGLQRASSIKYSLVIKFLIGIENIIIDLMTIVMPGWSFALQFASLLQLSSIKANLIINFHFVFSKMWCSLIRRRRKLMSQKKLPWCETRW